MDERYTDTTATSVKSRSRWLILTIVLVLVALPRFNRNSHFIERPPKDDVQYRLYVEFFRGAPVSDKLQSASTWRPVVPLIASVTPFKPMTALNVINLFALSGALYFMLATMMQLGATSRQVWLGGWLFVVSFPTFYYATIGYVDPGGIFFVSLGLYLAARRCWIGVIACAAVGVLAKESAFVLVPVLTMAASARKENKTRVVSLTAAALLVTIAASLWIRNAAPGIHYDSVWTPTLDVFLANAARPSAWLSAILTFGIPGLLAIRTLIKRRNSITSTAIHRLTDRAERSATELGTQPEDTLPEDTLPETQFDNRFDDQHSQIANKADEPTANARHDRTATLKSNLAFDIRHFRVTLIVGVAATTAMWCLALTSAYVDGRTLWPAMLFTIPLGVIGLGNEERQRR